MSHRDRLTLFLVFFNVIFAALSLPMPYPLMVTVWGVWGYAIGNRLGREGRG